MIGRGGATSGLVAGDRPAHNGWAVYSRVSFLSWEVESSRLDQDTDDGPNFSRPTANRLSGLI